MKPPGQLGMQGKSLVRNLPQTCACCTTMMSIISSMPPLTGKRMDGITDHTFRPGSAEPVGGVARFQTIVKEYRVSPCYADQPSLLTLFSGDAFNPSLESSVTKGRHMVPFLNAVGTDLACVGVRMAPFTLFPASIY